MCDMVYWCKSINIGIGIRTMPIKWKISVWYTSHIQFIEVTLKWFTNLNKCKQWSCCVALMVQWLIYQYEANCKLKCLLLFFFIVFSFFCFSKWWDSTERVHFAKPKKYENGLSKSCSGQKAKLKRMKIKKMLKWKEYQRNKRERESQARQMLCIWSCFKVTNC